MPQGKIAALTGAWLLALAWPDSLAWAQPTGWAGHAGGPDRTVRPSGLAEQVHLALQDSLRQLDAPVCQLSQRLSAAAAAHAEQLLCSQARPGTVAPRMVRREVWRAGGVAPVVVPWAYAFATATEPLAELPRLARRLAERPITHCGVAVAQRAGRKVVVLVGVRRRIELRPFPVQLARGDRVRLAGALVRGYVAPTILVSTPLGQVSRQQTLHRGRRIGSWLSFTVPGRYMVEVMARGPRGPEIVALFPVFVDLPPGELPAAASPESVAPAPDGATLVRRLGVLIDRTRRQAGLPPVTLDGRLSRVARQHCEEMARHHFFGHLSPSGADLEERLRRAGLASRRAAENLVRSANAAQGHSRLMESPAHQSNILDPQLTHLGMAAVPYQGEWLVTQIFVAW